MRSLLVLLTFVLLTTPCSVAQNLIQNPHFDIDLSEWTASASSPSAWDTLDADDAVESGSALLTNVVGNGGSTGILSQCFPVEEGDILDYSAKLYQPGGQSGDGYGHLRGRFYSSEGCSGFFASTGYGQSQPETLDTWFSIANSETAPATSASFRLYLAVVGEIINEQYAVHFDDVVLTIGQDASEIFSDGFENGTTDAWVPPAP